MKSQPQRFWQEALRLGLIGGAVAVLFSLVGMVQAFSARAIVGGLLSLSYTFLGGTIALATYAAARRAVPGGRGAVFASGAIAGVAAAVVLAFLIIVSSLVNLRDVLVNVSGELLALLTFGQSPVVAAVMWIGIGLVLGLVTGGVILLAPRVRQTVIQAVGWVIFIGLMADLIRLITDTWGPLAGLFKWMLSGKGLSVAGAGMVILVVVVVNALQARGRVGGQGPARRPLAAAEQGRQNLGRTVAALVVLALLPVVLGTYMSEVLDQVGLYILMGLGLNIVVGFAGLLDLGYVAFFAIGAYTTGVLTSPELGFFYLSWWAALPIAVGMSILAGILLGIPVLKMRGDYLAIVTLGFGEIVRLLVLSDWLKPYLGGPQGIQLIAKPTIGSFVFNDQQKLYYLLLAGCLLAAFVSWRLRDSRMGRAWMAMREDEDVAQAMGINLVSTKLLAFATGAAFSGLSGAIFATKLGAAYPNSFGLLISINVLAVIIIGGMGSIPGVIVGAAALVGLPELLREFAEFRLMVYGAVLVVMMLYRPEGLWPEAARKRELHEELDEAAQPGEILKTPGGAR
jgi:branched-chain amino acid transport system permease protein